MLDTVFDVVKTIVLEKMETRRTFNTSRVIEFFATLIEDKRGKNEEDCKDAMESLHLDNKFICS